VTARRAADLTFRELGVVTPPPLVCEEIPLPRP